MEKLFLNNIYVVLEAVYENTFVGPGEIMFSPVSQKEISEMIGLSRPAVNKIFGILKKEGYLEMVARGRWAMTRKAVKLIEDTHTI